jgi:hypothetical protein
MFRDAVLVLVLGRAFRAVCHLCMPSAVCQFGPVALAGDRLGFIYDAGAVFLPAEYLQALAAAHLG